MTHTSRKERIKRKVHRNGITLFGISYKSEALQQFLEGQDIDGYILLPLPAPRKIQIELAGGATFEFTAERLRDCAEAISQEEWIAAHAELKASGK